MEDERSGQKIGKTEEHKRNQIDDHYKDNGNNNRRNRIYNAVYAVIPPVTALLGAKTSEERVIAFPELGMEALHLIKVDRYPAIIGAAHGRSIYE